MIGGETRAASRKTAGVEEDMDEPLRGRQQSSEVGNLTASRKTTEESRWVASRKIAVVSERMDEPLRGRQQRGKQVNIGASQKTTEEPG